MPELLTDDTWRQLDPSTGRLARPDFRWVALGAAANIAALAVVLSGLVMPRLMPTGAAGYGYGDERDPWRIHYQFAVRNDGWFSVEIADVGRDGPGLALVGARGAGQRIDAGATADVGVTYEVTDCAAVPSEPWPVLVRVVRPWGTQTLWMELPRQSPMDFDLPARNSQGDASFWVDEVEWQRNLADAVCYHRDGIPPSDR